MRNSVRRIINVFSAVVVALIMSSLLLVSGCESEEKTADSDKETFTADTTTQKPLTPDYLYEMAVRRIGDANLVRTASVSGEGNDKVVTFDVIRPAVCHDGAVVGTVSTFSQKTMSALFKYPDISRVDVTLYGTTQDASSNSEVAVKITVDRDSARNIDWFALNDTNLASLVTSFYMDPRIQANWQVDGGGSTPHSQQTETVTAAPAI
jgi:hypothetical protein